MLEPGKPCSGEKLLLMFDRWRKLLKAFYSEKKGQFDISKVCTAGLVLHLHCLAAAAAAAADMMATEPALPPPPPVEALSTRMRRHRGGGLGGCLGC